MQEFLFGMLLGVLVSGAVVVSWSYVLSIAIARATDRVLVQLRPADAAVSVAAAVSEFAAEIGIRRALIDERPDRLDVAEIRGCPFCRRVRRFFLRRNGQDRRTQQD